MISYTGNSVETLGGAALVRGARVAFPAERTGAWEAGGTGTGYAWARLTPRVNDGTVSGSQAVSTTLVSPEDLNLIRETGQYAIALDGSTAYESGMRGWLEVVAEATCYVFHPTPAGAGLGAPRVTTTATELNDDPATQVTIATTDEPDATTPLLQHVVAEDITGATVPGVGTISYPTGTGGDALWQYATNPSANTLNVQTGGSSLTQYVRDQYVLDASDRLTQYAVSLALWDGAASTITATTQYVVDTGEIEATVPANMNYVFEGDVTFTGTVTGAGASAASPVWTLVDTITHADLTDVDTSQDVTAYTIPANTVFGGSIVKTKTVGSGGGVGALTTQLLIAGSTVGNAGNGIIANDTAAQGLGGASSAGALMGATSATTRTVAVRFTADVDVADLTGGEWEVYLLLSTLP
jgi:hypothetical protein